MGDRIAVAALVTALAAVGIGSWLALAGGASTEPTPGELLDPFGGSASIRPVEPVLLVVDIEGAVMRPGIIELPGGARVADAIAAAGGYAPEADLTAAASQVNLAATLQDGQQITVPALGAPPAGSTGGGGPGGGLVNLNSASPEALDALPGIGPVTVGKIVSARAEQPFGSLQELVTRKVLTTAQLDKIRDLVTVG
jgi:competence protein ComEA